ncbi:MAG: 2-hydroxyacid dehydrogenase [Negativicutes bacterium]|nr:2-hydroxyacid dehydrogenase [Negativicutes bacterium]
MKVLVVGDPLLTSKKLTEAVVSTLGNSVEVSCVDWVPASEEEFWYLRSQVEKFGPGKGKPPEELLTAVADVDMIVTQHTPLNAEIISRAKRCTMIGVCRAGVENVDVEAASAQGIAVFQTMGRNAHAVSDFTIGMMLSEMRNIARSHAALMQGNWQKKYSNTGFIGDMPGKVVGLVGFGYIGRLVAKKLSCFEVEVVAYDPFTSEQDIAAAGARKVTLEELCRISDFISVHARLSKETEGLIGKKELAVMKPTAYVINTARAGLINEQALMESLEGGKIGGAALDVFWVEPPPEGHPLLRLSNVTITPHLAGSTTDAFGRTPYLLLAEVKRVLEGGDMRWVVNRDKVPAVKGRI